MPRLLLVDDNPSIHKIAETLLATTPIELVCVDSAAAALEKVNKGEHFDVALVDISMAVMDGWGLLAKFREMPATARMPIAMMAGVLDTVDPERIKVAPIQGFLKKPVELRDLGDRVARLMEIPVAIPEPPAPPPPPSEPEPPIMPPAVPKAVSPFATLPAVRIEDLPEFRKIAEPVPEFPNDLLELTEEDLYPEPVPEVLVETPPEESLDLEELDLDSLRGLSVLPEEPAAPTPLAEAFQFPDEPSEPTPQAQVFPVTELDAIATLDRLPFVPGITEPPAVIEDLEISDVDLPDLGPVPEDLMEISSLSNLPEMDEIVTSSEVAVDEVPLALLLEDESEETPSFTPPLPPMEESLDWSDDSESMLAVVDSPDPASQMETGTFAPLPEEELDLLEVSVPETSLETAAELSTLQLDLEEEPMVLSPFEEKPEAEIVLQPMEPLSAPIPTEALVESALRESALVGEVPLVETATPPGPVAAIPPVSLAAMPGSTKELLDAMMSDPAMMDALAKAVVARLGDQVLREIAWEVMPELAERLPRN